jgi:hypothetical protein
MRVVIAALLIGCTSLVGCVRSSGRTDFSGRWADAASQMTAVVTQTPSALTFEMLHEGQSAGPTTIPLDSAEHTTLVEGRSYATRSSWDHGKLVIVTKVTPSDNGPSTITQTWSSEGARLTIAMSQAAANGDVLRQLSSTFTRMTP